jgi:hypothetical protein
VTTVAVLSGPERRQRGTSAEKRRILEESLEFGARGQCCRGCVPSRQDDEVRFEFVAGARMWITSAVDATTLKAAVAALVDGPPQ